MLHVGLSRSASVLSLRTQQSSARLCQFTARRLNGSIAIVGAGPAGLISALALARRGGFDDITIIDGEENPEDAPRFNPDRSYTIDITGHGLNALKYIEATKRMDEELIPFAGLRLRFMNMKEEPWEDKGWTGSRGDICRSLTREIHSQQPGKVNFEYDTWASVVDIYDGKVELQKGGVKTEKKFDLILGCDGAGSAARKALADNVPGFEIEASTVGNHCSMLHFDTPAAGDLNPSWLEIFSMDPFLVAGAINGEKGKDGSAKWFCMVGYPEEMTFETTDEAKAYITASGGQEILDRFVSDEELEAFIKRPCNNIGRSKVCSQYHGGKLVMVGDAANPFPPIGQGVNAAMEAAVHLDQIIGKSLDEGKSLQHAAAQYTIEYKPQGDAVNWIARRFDMANPFKLFLVKAALVADVSVLNSSKKGDISYKEVADAAKARNPEEWVAKLKAWLN